MRLSEGVPMKNKRFNSLFSVILLLSYASSFGAWWNPLSSFQSKGSRQEDHLLGNEGFPENIGDLSGVPSLSLENTHIGLQKPFDNDRVDNCDDYMHEETDSTPSITEEDYSGNPILLITRSDISSPISDKSDYESDNENLMLQTIYPVSDEEEGSLGSKNELNDSTDEIGESFLDALKRYYIVSNGIQGNVENAKIEEELGGKIQKESENYVIQESATEKQKKKKITKMKKLVKRFLKSVNKFLETDLGVDRNIDSNFSVERFIRFFVASKILMNPIYGCSLSEGFKDKIYFSLSGGTKVIKKIEQMKRADLKKNSFQGQNLNNQKSLDSFGSFMKKLCD